MTWTDLPFALNALAGRVTEFRTYSVFWTVPETLAVGSERPAEGLPPVVPAPSAVDPRVARPETVRAPDATTLVKLESPSAIHLTSFGEVLNCGSGSAD